MPNIGFPNVPPLTLLQGDDITLPQTTRFDINGSMSNGVLTTTKQLHFKVPDGVSPRAYNICDIVYHDLFPQRGSVLAEDARLYFTGDAQVNHFTDDSRIITVDLTYTTPNFSVDTGGTSNSQEKNNTDSDGNKITDKTPPWKLLPQDLRVTYPTYEAPMYYAYNSKGELFKKDGDHYRAVNPTVNTAGAPFNITGEVITMRQTFSFYAKNWNVAYGFKYGNTVNSTPIKICNVTYNAGAALLRPPQCTQLITRDNKGKVKWKYCKIDITIEFDPLGRNLVKAVPNIGDKAYFQKLEDLNNTDDVISTLRITKADITIPSTPYPQQIVEFRPFSHIEQKDANGRYLLVPNMHARHVCGYEQFLTYRNMVIQNANALGYVTPDPQCEQLHDVPLDAQGFVDFDALNGKRTYIVRKFFKYPMKNWAALNLPKKA